MLRELKDSSIDDLAFSGADLAKSARLVDDGAVTTAAAKTIYAEMAAGKGVPQGIVLPVWV